MDYFCELTGKLKELLHNDEITPLTREIKVDGLNFLQLRDAILVLGDVFEENQECQIYVASIKAGILKLGHAYFAAKLVDGILYISAFANEGLINQHMAEKSIDSLTGLLKKKNVDQVKIKTTPKVHMPKRKKKKAVLYICVGFLAAILIASVIICSIITGSFAKSTKEYNNAVTQYNSVVETYNQKCSAAFLANLQGFSDNAPVLPCVDTDFWSLLKSFLNGNNTAKVNSDIEALNSVTKKLQANISVLDQIINPEVSFVSDCVKRIQGVTDVGCVTPDNDPNQMLGKDGGYTGCVYFTLSDIDAKLVKGNDAIAKGTDGGGAVEIYATKEDALARCDYFEQFKDTLLYSGSYAVVGTVVIRTSFHLDDQQQYEYTSKIVDELISPSK